MWPDVPVMPSRAARLVKGLPGNGCFVRHIDLPPGNLPPGTGKGLMGLRCRSLCRWSLSVTTPDVANVHRRLALRVGTTGPMLYRMPDSPMLGPESSCPACGNPTGNEEQFCTACGAQLPLAQGQAASAVVEDAAGGVPWSLGNIAAGLLVFLVLLVAVALGGTGHRRHLPRSRNRARRHGWPFICWAGAPSSLRGTWAFASSVLP